MPRVLILADDLTGAADSGAQFARLGWRTLLVLEPGSGEIPKGRPVSGGNEALPPSGGNEALVLDSETRALPESRLAARAVTQALADLSASTPLAGFSLAYKKIDSTLRGHPGAELAATLAYLSEQRALIAPAFPAQGRTTLEGCVYVHGLRLGETSFAAEAGGGGDLHQIFGPAVETVPLATVRAGGDALRAALEKGPALLVADAMADGDLKELAQAGLAAGIRVFCGSAGLAGALVTILGPGKYPVQPAPPSIQPALAVVGSLHAASVAQVSAARQAGAEFIQPPLACFTGPEPIGMEETAARLVAALQAGKDAILATRSVAEIQVEKGASDRLDGYTQQTSLLPQAEISARLARISALALKEFRPGGLFLSGGDTARAVCRAMGCTRLWLGGEVEPGIPWSRLADGPQAGLTAVTKAGGFGAADALRAAIQFIHQGTSPPG